MQNKIPTISIAMPTYNGGRYLREQLDSIYCQTKQPDEVIVVDDCSTDNTIEILKEFHKKYGLKYYINEKNLGYNKNFEKAITLCSSDFIALCDQDDIWLPEKIEKTYNKLKEYPKDIPALVSSFNSTDINILKCKVKNKCQSGGWHLNFTKYASQGCTLMFNKKLKDIIIPIPDGIMYDAYIGFTAALLGNRYYIGEQLMYYRIHNDNAFAKKHETSKYQIFKKEINKHLPYWFDVERKEVLHFIINIHKNNIKKERLEYVNSILKLYEVGIIKRILILISIKKIPIKIKYKTILCLFVKYFFKIGK